MHYFSFNIADYAIHTRHLTLMQDIAYRRLLDWYYLNEKPINSDYARAATLILMLDFKDDIKVVLNEFFTKTKDGWINKRANKEIAVYKGFSDAGKRGAAKRWSTGGDSLPIAPPIANIKHKTLTINQEQLTNINTKTFQPLARLMSLKVSEQIAKDWLAIRKAKRKPLTETALTRIINQAQKGGYTLQAALTISCEEGWAGFGHDWKTNNSLNNDEPKVVKIAWYSTEEATTKKGIEIGCPRLPTDDTGSYRERIQKQLSGESND